ncbi:MAG: hypothetical protein ACRCSG_09170 [Cellulosilyticaceae bacterium]
MSTLLTKRELAIHLNNFREILGNFDYSSLKNIRFFNLDSMYSYMETVKDNPFTKQYDALQKELDFLQPYLPFVSNERASEFLDEISKANSDEEVSTIKKEYTKKIRQDFIDLARTTTTARQWEDITFSCEQIRLHKEELCLASS